MDNKEEIEKVEAKKKLADKLKLLRLGTSDKNMLYSQRKLRYRFTRGGKTKRA